MSLPVGEIICGDCLDVMRGWPDGCVDAVITDPPYGLRFMGKRWDYDVPSVEIWREVHRVLKDGGRLLAFSGARTQHRMVCNIEDAGFCIEDCMMWLYGSGFPKHGSKLKPAYEPICVARKGSVSLLNIDAGRIAANGESLRGGSVDSITGVHDGYKRPCMDSPEWRAEFYARKQGKADIAEALGRWPANVCLDESAAAMLDAQSGYSDSGTGVIDRRNIRSGFAPGERTDKLRGDIFYGPADSGGASRFFYCAKASSAERNSGCGSLVAKQVFGDDGGTYQGLSNSCNPSTNHHPTVKPLALMQWLISLTTFDGALILDPFAGSGSTLVAAERLGRRWIGVDISPEYCEIARKRTAQRGLFTEAA